MCLRECKWILTTIPLPARRLINCMLPFVFSFIRLSRQSWQWTLLPTQLDSPSPLGASHPDTDSENIPHFDSTSVAPLLTQASRPSQASLAIAYLWPQNLLLCSARSSCGQGRTLFFLALFEPVAGLPVFFPTFPSSEDVFSRIPFLRLRFPFLIADAHVRSICFSPNSSLKPSAWRTPPPSPLRSRRVRR